MTKMELPKSSFTQALAGAVGGALLGMTVAWWTAQGEKGVTRKDMEEYVRDYSPYMIDKGALTEHQHQQDDSISRISEVQQNVLKRLNALEKYETDKNTNEP